MNNQFVFLYVTCQNEDEAKKIATVLIEEKLAACANILPKMTSLYLWQEKIEQSSEAVLILKTLKALRPKISTRLADLHSYQFPCVAEIDITSLNSSYASWLKSNLL